MTFDPAFLLFVPADRPDRFARALSSGAGGAIVDLEDAVASERKAEGRDALREFLSTSSDRSRVVVRVNAPGTDDGRRDLEMLARVPACAGCVVPKVEDVADLEPVGAACGDLPQIALIETARGLIACDAVARSPQVIALAFGPYDLAADLGCVAEDDVLAPHRARVIVAARAAGRLTIDGPSREYADAAIVERDARRARRVGFDGKLLIHPAQIAPVRAAFAPTPEEIAEARRIVAGADGASLATLDGAMIDRPIVLSARRTLLRIGDERVTSS